MRKEAITNTAGMTRFQFVSPMSKPSQKNEAVQPRGPKRAAIARSRREPAIGRSGKPKRRAKTKISSLAATYCGSPAMRPASSAASKAGPRRVLKRLATQEGQLPAIRYFCTPESTESSMAC